MIVNYVNQLSDWAGSIREICDGSWFFLNLSLAVVFTWYSWNWLKRVVWPWDKSTQAAIGLAIYFFGGTIRAGYLWLQWMSINNNWGLDFWKKTQTEIILALIICIIGGSISVKVFVSDGYGRTVSIIVILACLILPVIIRFVL
jgi:glucan phosphoethanolaminetransferase (alkaline phosphatase superfamily)